MLPRWLAPNLITLTGLFALLATYALHAAYLPEFEHPGPRWLYLLAAVSVFFYLHMDALDGKQARATKTSSPLGQLFDHGCDALAVHLILTVMVSSLQMGHEWRTIVSMLYVFVPWWMAHWEEYHTGVMLYGNGLWGVTEANYSVVMLHLYTFMLGGGGWTARPLASLLQATGAEKVLPALVASFLSALKVNDLFLMFFGMLGLALFVGQVARVVRQLEHTALPKKERGNKTLGVGPAAYHLLQILVTCGCGGALLCLPVTVPGQSRVLMATFGVTYALQATRLIMAHMAKEPFCVALWPLALMGAQIANHFVEAMDAVLMAYAVNALVVAGYLHYVISVTNEICAFLGIRALTIKPAAE